MKRLPALMFALVLGGACAHTPPKSDLEELRPVVEGFHKNLRWRNYRALSSFLVPEERKDFERQRRELHDDRDLTVTDFEIEDVKLADDGRSATVHSRIQWMRLPSVTEQTDTVTSEFVFRDGVWLLEKQQSGPFDGELEPKETPSP
ncbi:hypothetical protein D7W79_35700 [Corallococcus exercitus]|uniref:hypothetical protein n=1 Tax=Corallococcus exercitus TaxID=2316736 RepID=UPI000EA363BF|nr:hypothetical protein [Corallococcus exercitus]RKG67133.1 hypothetical protein D7W79_35700 [Corallococcus exercitus]